MSADLQVVIGQQSVFVLVRGSLLMMPLSLSVFLSVSDCFRSSTPLLLTVLLNGLPALDRQVHSSVQLVYILCAIDRADQFAIGKTAVKHGTPVVI